MYRTHPKIKSAGLAACGIALGAAGIAGSLVLAAVFLLGA